MYSVRILQLLNKGRMKPAGIRFQIGGFGSGGVTNELRYFVSGSDGLESGKWLHLSSVPHIECSNFGCVVVENEIYVVGGCFNQVFIIITLVIITVVKTL